MKFGTKKKRILISCDSGRLTHIMAYVSANGLWAIHRPYSRSEGKNGFHVTHMPSGYNINRRGKFRTIAACKKAVRAISPVANWEKCVEMGSDGLARLPESIARKARLALDRAFKNTTDVIASRDPK